MSLKDWVGPYSKVAIYKDLPEDKISIIREGFNKLEALGVEYDGRGFGMEKLIKSPEFEEFKKEARQIMIDIATAASGNNEVFQSVVEKTSGLIIDLFGCFEEGEVYYDQYQQLGYAKMAYLRQMAKRNPNYLVTIDTLFDVVTYSNSGLRNDDGVEMMSRLLKHADIDTNEVTLAELIDWDNEGYRTGIKNMADHLVEQTASSSNSSPLKKSSIF